MPKGGIIVSKYLEILLSSKKNLVVNADLAVAIGLNEAIVLRQIFYWIEGNKERGINYQDGRYWTYNTLDGWQKDNFPFWSTKTIQRALLSLENKKIVISGNYNKEKFDKTKWYTIDYDMLETILTEKFKEQEKSE